MSQTTGDFRKHNLTAVARVSAALVNLLLCPVPCVMRMKAETLAYGYMPPFLIQNLSLGASSFQSPDPWDWDLLFTFTVGFTVSRTGDCLIGVVRSSHVSDPLGSLYDCISPCWLWPAPLSIVGWVVRLWFYHTAVKRQIFLKLHMRSFLREYPGYAIAFGVR